MDPGLLRSYQGANSLVFGRAGNGPPDVSPISCQAKERAGVDGAGHNSGKVVGLGEGKLVDDGGWLWWDMESFGLRAFEVKRVYKDEQFVFKSRGRMQK